MTNNPYAQANKAYGQMNDEGMKPVEIVVELYKGMLRFLREAKGHAAEKDFMAMFHKCDRAFKVIEALQAHLMDSDETASMTETLRTFYAVTYTRISKVLDTPDAQAEFDSIIASVQQVYESWYKIAYPARDTAAQG